MTRTNGLAAAMAAAAACLWGCGGGVGGVLSPAASLGVACNTSQDCPSGVTCHTDTGDYIANDQCTTSCTTDDECHTMFGADSHCIGANICVRDCTTDNDCPALSICNGYGWCDRTGPGSGNPYCEGIPYSCSTYPDPTSCGYQYGCSFSGGCSGTVSTCPEFTDSESCMFLVGCTWDGACIGTADSCADMPLSICGLQEGCQVANN